jgi:6-phosphogluconolactonase
MAILPTAPQFASFHTNRTLLSMATGKLIVASSQKEVASLLNNAIVSVCQQAIEARGAFTIALSGGSSPSFLASIHDAFQLVGVDPMYHCWHVLLADERCVPSSDPENNLQSIRDNFLSKVPIPDSQIHGIDESLLNGSTDAIASAYELVVRKVLKLSGGLLDCAVLGFGPDGTHCGRYL